MNQDPAFFIDQIPVKGRLILAPMDGISDQPFRLLTHRLGSSLTYTEFINAIDVLFGHPHLEQHLTYTEEERPLIFQLYDESPERILRAALKLRPRNPDAIDINMGCSARTVSGRGAGAGLLRDPDKVFRLVQMLVNALDIPITAKIRLGWAQNTRNHIEIASAIQEAGGKMIAVHGRTRDQSFNHPADWQGIHEVKQAVSIPVIGNGDVTTPADALRMINETGVNGVMIGRAAVSNPWIFSGYDRSSVPLDLVRSTSFEHLQLMTRFYGLPRGIIVFRKFIKRYLAPYHLDPSVIQALMETEESSRFASLLDSIFSRLSGK